MSDLQKPLTAADMAALAVDVGSGHPGQAARDVNERCIAAFRANGGVVPAEFSRFPLTLITMIGAKSGRERVVPLAYIRVEGRLFIIASAGGRPNNPVWYDSLVANPDVTVEIGTERFAATAVSLQGEERERIYAGVCAQIPGFAIYQTKTSRVIPVVELLRQV